MVRLASCLLVITSLAFGSQAQRDNPDELRQQKFDQLMMAMFAHAEKARATPITEPRIPIQKVNGIWSFVLYKATDDSVVVTYTLAPDYKFYVQAILCDLDNDTKIPDATFLGVAEKASTFYNANLRYLAEDSVVSAKCQPVHAVVQIEPGTPPVYRSHERALRHMCNYLRFFAHDRDTSRVVDFLTFILAKQREVLIDADSEGDLSRAKTALDLFDRFFPYEIFDGRPALTPADLAISRAFFETALLYRRKLNALSPETAARIPKDEALLRTLR